MTTLCTLLESGDSSGDLDQAFMTETPAATLPTISELSSPNENRIRSTKRKLDDAFQILDNAVAPNPTVDRPSPPKKTNTIRSLYSTLAKYGIKSGTSSNQVSSSNIPSTKTPHLSAILSRAATKTKNTFTFRFSSQSHTPGPVLPATAEYRPSSLSSFLTRLATFKLATYANKPPSIDAVAASKCGWINDGKDRLACGLCNASWVLSGREGLNRDAANALIEKQRVGLVESHKEGCPWKTRQCDDSIYCIPLQSPASMIKEIKDDSIKMDSFVKDILIKHPLTTSQLNSLRSCVNSYDATAITVSVDSETPAEEEHNPPTPPEPSENAILASLFGWTLVPPAPESVRRASGTRANSTAPSILGSPALSRASSVSLPHTPTKQTKSSSQPSFRLPTNLLSKPENALLQCELCQRRIGLWAFSSRPPEDDSMSVDLSLTQSQDTLDGSPQNPATARPKKPLPRRSLDLLKEHRSYCPYVVRSTVVPSFPTIQTAGTAGRSSTSSNGHSSGLSLSQLNGKGGVQGALEGWRAVLTVVLRYGMAQKQRIEYNFLTPKDSDQSGEDPDKMDVDSVKAMVTGVKARGGKDLLKYVKGLLG